MKRTQIDELLSRGYLYCMECMAFTPHVSVYNPEWSWTKRKKACEICDNEVTPNDYSTCKCGYDFEKDLEDMDYEYTFHGEGCHFGVTKNYTSIKDILENEIESDEVATSLADEIYWEFFNNLSLADRIKLGKFHTNKEKCGCRTVMIYKNTPVLSYSSWAGHGMDCMNHVEWEYELKCPVCRRKHYIQDGNC